jgi:2-keto-4-pentenoate hydratase
MSFDAERVAELIADARRQRRRMEPLPPDLAPATAAEGAAAQAALARRMGAMPPAGFKVGATAKRMQDYLGLSGPVAGFMPAAGLHSSGAALPFATFTSPGVECEILVRLARDLPPGPCTPEQARSAVGALFAGIEIVENRYGDLAAIGVPSLMADQVYHAACIAGDPPADWRALDVASLAGSMTVNGELRGEGVGADLLGHPLNCLAWLAGSAEAAAFGGLRAGQVVMLGSVTPPIWLDGPSLVTVAFTSLPPVEVRLT